MSMNDENEFISGECWGCVTRGRRLPCHKWRWLDVGGGGSLGPAEPGTSLQDGPYIENLLGLAEHHQAQAVVMV